MMWPVHCIQGSKGAEYHPDFEFNPDVDIEVLKGTKRWVESYSGFGGEGEDAGLERKPREHDVKAIYVVGLAYDYCVGSTAIDGAKLGFKTFLLEDASRAVGPETTKRMN